MRTLFVFTILLFSNVSLLAQSDDFFKDANTFFKTYVTNGQVRYADIKQNPEMLNALYTQLNEIKPKLSEPLKYQAFYINAYNLAVINTIIKEYPINSPQQVGGFFERIEHPIAGQKITLNYLENELLRKNFDEPRFHFVLVCGALSCPPIVNFAYTPQLLNVQLEQQATLALNNNDFVRVKPDMKTVALSQIFKWYKEDFTAQQSEIEFLNQYRRDEIPTDYQIDYYEYNWLLNDVNNPAANPSAERPSSVEPTLSLQTYTAGTLLKKGQMDFTLFNTIYTETKGDFGGGEYSGGRTTFATSLLQWTIGVDKKARFNLGFDIALRGTGAASQETSLSAVNRAFQFTNSDSTRFGIASFGPRIKFLPFKGVNNFSIQSSFAVSPSEAPEGRSATATQEGRIWIEWNRYIWWNQFFYTYTFAGDKFQLFAELDLLFRFKREKTQINHMDLPVSVILSYFPTKQITVYAITQYVSRLAGSPVYDDARMDITNDFVLGGYYAASGAGFKYQFADNLNVELLYTNFWGAKNNGLGETYNLGIKYLVL